MLSHPLLAAAIENEFVAVVVRNNVKGPEDELRKRFEEPAWNNPVVRFVDGKGKDLIPRKDGVWSTNGIATRMVKALKAAKRPVPGYLQVALAESAKNTLKAVFQMHCYWEGEAHLGALDGVVKTTSAWHASAEVVEVVYLPDVISKQKLTAAAQAKSCKPVATDTVRVAKASDQQHALNNTPFAQIDLTPMQRTKVHAALTNKTDWATWLTPKQRARVRKLAEKKRAKK